MAGRILAALILLAAVGVGSMPAFAAMRLHVPWLWAALDVLLALRFLALRGMPPPRAFLWTVGLPMVLLTAAFVAGPLGPGLGLLAALLAAAGIARRPSRNGSGEGL